MKKLIIISVLLMSTSLQADSVKDALNHLLGMAFETGCLRYGYQSASNIDKKEVRKFCIAQTAQYVEELKKLNSDSKVKTSDGTEVTW